MAPGRGQEQAGLMSHRAGQEQGKVRVLAVFRGLCSPQGPRSQGKTSVLSGGLNPKTLSSPRERWDLRTFFWLSGPYRLKHHYLSTSYRHTSTQHDPLGPSPIIAGCHHLLSIRQMGMSYSN